MEESYGVKKELVELVRKKLDGTNEITDDYVREVIDQLLILYGKQNYISIDEKCQLSKQIFNSIRGLDVLQSLIEDNSISEIMVNGYQSIFIERNGKIEPVEECFESEERLQNIIQQMVSKSNRIINETNPIVDTRLQNGSRVNIVLPPVAIDGAVITIRKFPEHAITMEELIRIESITLEAANFLEKLVIAGYNIFISGGTGSGKTTFLNVLSNYIPKDERIITIEDSAELQIKSVPNLVRLEVKNANVEGKHAITIRDLIRSSLRMRPDRIIVGEVRDEAAIDMLQALNTGHDGSLSTGHANSPADMLSRLESLVLMGCEIPLMAVRRQIASAIDIIVHLGRLRDHTRKVLEICEVLGCKDDVILIQPLYVFKEDSDGGQDKVSGHLVRTEHPLVFTEKLLRAGIKIQDE